MKKLLWLLFTPLLIGQIDIVNTTAQLQLHEGTGVIILNSPDAAGGVYTCIDSAYSEGTYAFPHPYTGKQWAKLGYAIAGTFSALTIDGVATLSSATLSSTLEVNDDITLENDEVLSNSTDGDFSITFNEDDDSLGSFIIKSLATLSPANADSGHVDDNDHMEIIFQAPDDSATITDWVKLIATVTDVSDESEDSKIEIKTFAAGSQVTPLTLTGANATIAGTVQSTGGAVFLTGTGGSATDSSMVFSGSSGTPVLSFYGTDGDAYAVSINTDDEMVLSGMSALYVPSSIAGIDSFWLELTTDTINIAGVAPGDVFTFSEYCPDYDAAIDTVTFSYKCESGRVLVTRATAGDVSAPSYKSVGKYAYIRMTR